MSVMLLSLPLRRLKSARSMNCGNFHKQQGEELAARRPRSSLPIFALSTFDSLYDLT